MIMITSHYVKQEINKTLKDIWEYDSGIYYLSLSIYLSIYVCIYLSIVNLSCLCFAIIVALF